MTKAALPHKHFAVARDVMEYVRLLVRTFCSLPADVLIASVVINLLGLAIPLAILQVYDRIIPQAATSTLLFLILCVCAALLFEAVLRITRSQVIAWSAMKDAWRLNVDAAARVAFAPPSLVDHEPAAYWMQRFQAVGTASEFKLSPPLPALIDLPFTVIFFGLLFAISPLLSAIPVVLFVVFAVAATDHGRRLRAVTLDRASAEAKVRDFLVEVLNGIVTVKAFAMEQQVLRRFEHLAEQASGCSYNLVRLAEGSRSLGSLVSTTTQLTTATVGAVLAIQGELTIGALACCTMLAGRVMQPLMRLVSASNEIHGVIVASETAKSIFDLPSSSHHEPALAAGPELPAQVTFDNVTFQHEGETAPVLSGANLVVQPGEILAIMGPNGSGRSTAARLALGQLVPQAGQVLIDEIPAALAGTGICGRLAYVDHHVSSVRGTVLDNLTMFHEGEGIDSAEEIARLIGLDDDIHRLPRGYETGLGETATDVLSPGLMQRIMIARALASHPRLLILDEVNGSFDNRAERLLVQGLVSLKGRLTIVLITNRAPFAAIADRIVTIANGKFVPLDESVMSPKAIT